MIHKYVNTHIHMYVHLSYFAIYVLLSLLFVRLSRSTSLLQRPLTDLIRSGFCLLSFIDRIFASYIVPRIYPTHGRIDDP